MFWSFVLFGISLQTKRGRSFSSTLFAVRSISVALQVCKKDRFRLCVVQTYKKCLNLVFKLWKNYEIINTENTEQELRKIYVQLFLWTAA